MVMLGTCSIRRQEAEEEVVKGKGYVIALPTFSTHGITVSTSPNIVKAVKFAANPFIPAPRLLYRAKVRTAADE